MYGSTHTATIPTVGVTAGPTYAQQINAALEEIRATLDAKVTPAGMDISSNLSFLSGSTYFAAVDLERTNYENKTAGISAATFPRSLYVVSGNLFYNDGSGNAIQLTTGGTVNVSTAGGITGTGYGTGGVELNWNAGTTQFRFKSGAGTDDYADVVCDDLLLRDGSGNAVSLTAQAMASDYTVTLPAAVPAAQAIVQMTNAGALVASNTMAANQHVIVSGTGRFKHGSMTKVVPAISATNVGGDLTILGVVTGAITLNSADDMVIFNPDLPTGARITSWRLRCQDTSNTAVTAADARIDTGFTAHGNSVSSGGTGTQTISDASFSNHTMVAGEAYVVRVTVNNSTDDCNIFWCEFTYDYP